MALKERVLRERFNAGLLLLDGATGTELTRRGVSTPLPLWSAAALLDAPETVREIHRDYVVAGAEIVVANTFRTNPRTLGRAELLARGAEMNRLAVALAREGVDCAETTAGRRGGVLIAASVAPVEDCYRPELVPSDAELRAEHEQMVEWLAAADADLVWIETMGVAREALAAAAAARAAGLPFVVSMVLREDGRLLGGDRLEAAIATLEPLAPLAFGVNCVPPLGVQRATAALRRLTRLPLAAYAHIGNAEPLCGWSFSQDISPPEYAHIAAEWWKSGASIIGGCCGTTPPHIEALRKESRCWAETAPRSAS